jgi:transposase-like protein
MQILHPFEGTAQQYLEMLPNSTPDHHRPRQCPQCQSQQPLVAHGFYTRTLTCAAFESSIPIRRYLCRCCRRTVSLLPQFALPYLRFSLLVLAVFLAARLLTGATLRAAMQQAHLSHDSWQRGQFWIRRFRAKAEVLCLSLAALVKPPADTAPSFVHRALTMLAATGWIPAHRFLLASLREHLLGWPPALTPAGHRATIHPA